jgi:hypothetical protein
VLLLAVLYDLYDDECGAKLTACAAFVNGVCGGCLVSCLLNTIRADNYDYFYQDIKPVLP